MGENDSFDNAIYGDEVPLLTEDEAYESVYNYIDNTLGVYNILKYNGYIQIGEDTAADYVINVRSYTGVTGFYYVNKSTGDVYEQWMNPVTNEPEPSVYLYTITRE